MSKQERVLNASEVTVSTATIEVKVMKLNNRQMTLAVFRQLKVEDLLDSDGKKKGTPWGTINYHTDDCKDFYSKKSHLHVIWQKGDELRHAIVSTASYPNLTLQLLQLDQLFIAV